MQGARALLARARVDLAEVSLQRAALSDADAERLLVLAGGEAARMELASSRNALGACGCQLPRR